jgi:PAS domain S-box-containing protein
MDIGLEGIMARLESAMEAGGMAWWEIELPSGVVFFDQNKVRMLGYDSKDFVHYRNFTDLLHPDDYDQAMQAMTDHLEGRTPTYHTIYRIKTSTGEYRVFFDRGKIVSNDGKGALKVAGMVVDVTDGLDQLADFTKPEKMRTALQTENRGNVK